MKLKRKRGDFFRMCHLYWNQGVIFSVLLLTHLLYGMGLNCQRPIISLFSCLLSDFFMFSIGGRKLMTFGVQISFCRFDEGFTHLTPLAWNKCRYTYTLNFERSTSIASRSFPSRYKVWIFLDSSAFRLLLQAKIFSFILKNRSWGS